jgi:hypothetical protein
MLKVKHDLLRLLKQSNLKFDDVKNSISVTNY